MVAGTSFQNIIGALQEYWSANGCLLLQPYDMEMGAGTFHVATTLWTLSKESYRAAYVQPSRRPKDSRFGENPNRLYKHHQFQVILKPAPADIQELYLGSLEYIGLRVKEHDIRFVEDDWEGPTLGAAGLGWEVWCDGTEVSQFTYMQQMGGIECAEVPGEITYGLERLALYIQRKENVFDLTFNSSRDGVHSKTYRDVFKQSEYEFSVYALNEADTKMLFDSFEMMEKECIKLLDAQLALPAYEHCVRASNIFNLLDSRGVISVTERACYISRVRNMAKQCCETWLRGQEKNV